MRVSSTHLTGHSSKREDYHSPKIWRSYQSNWNIHVESLNSLGREDDGRPLTQLDRRTELRRWTETCVGYGPPPREVIGILLATGS